MFNDALKELSLLNANVALIPELLEMIVCGVESKENLNKGDLSQYIYAFSEISSVYLMMQTKKLNELEKLMGAKMEVANE
ncbi:hypothetical protein NYR60_01300 [Actinobacillus genomosp. 2]|uniref:hypothetical protein n=1 Tax=Actinobacillus genomosp. 2 TaxID=230709 RepID=UPI002442D05F|nr:hypothetical protein [Actinobacillus genomosp. 2]WGE32282.1 hypothetical protein NYR60_01300 [Actinobacillus genomosp. 2]